jgi:hypothetical protein
MVVQRVPFQLNTYTLTDNANPQAHFLVENSGTDTQYQRFEVVVIGGQLVFTAQVRQESNPSIGGQGSAVMPSSAGQHWRFGQANYANTTYIDDYQEFNLPQ